MLPSSSSDHETGMPSLQKRDPLPSEVSTHHPSLCELRNSERSSGQPTDGSVSEDSEDFSAWMGAIGSDLRTMATCFKDSTLPVLGGVASFVRNTAMTMAAEIAQLERDEDAENGGQAEYRWLPLPWEVEQGRQIDDECIPVFVTDTELMAKILALSLNDSTFTTPCLHPKAQHDVSPKEEFIIDESKIYVIQRILDVDENLAAAHSRLLAAPTRVKEPIFWRNYFLHCERTRKVFLQGRSEQESGLAPGPEEATKYNTGLPAFSSDEARNNFTNDVDMADPSDDNSTMIPASITDDSSYVIYPSPNSGDTFGTTRSVDDLVLVGFDVPDNHHD